MTILYMFYEILQVPRSLCRTRDMTSMALEVEEARQRFRRMKKRPVLHPITNLIPTHVSSGTHTEASNMQPLSIPCSSMHATGGTSTRPRPRRRGFSQPVTQ